MKKTIARDISISAARMFKLIASVIASVSTTVTIAVAVLTACSSSQQPAPLTSAAPVTTNESSSWHDKMQALSTTLSNLLPLVASSAQFSDPKNVERVQTETTNLKTLAHSLKHGQAPNADPSMKAMTTLFEDDIARASGALANGNREFARRILRDATSYCIECHTQANNGPNFPRLNLNVDTKQLPPLDRAEFFAATRQFDRALDAYRDALKTLKDRFEWETAARTAVAITVKVKNNAKETQSLVSKISRMRTAPKMLQPVLKHWKSDIDDWRKEKVAPPKTNAERVSKADALIAAAQQRQKFPLDHAQDIPYFRANSLLHEVLQSGEKDKAVLSHALFSAGVAGEATRDMNFWQLHETYFEQCIRTVPHSAQAKACFDKLNDAVTLGYTGSSGTHVPPEVAARLAKFAALSGAEKQGDAENTDSSPAATPTASP